MKKILAQSLAVLIIATLLTPQAHAVSLFDIANPAKLASGMLKQILSSLGFDQDEINYAAKTFNESRQKKQAPQVTLNFEPVNPAPGEKIKATAQIMNFFNSTENLYYTWYIKHASGNKDLNGDADIDIEDYKIEAARIIASNDFDWERANYAQDSDDDGYEAIFGGENQRGREAHCFYHDNKSGNEIEIECLHLFPDDGLSGDLGEDNFGKEREAFWHTDPTNADTRGSGNADEANVIGLGIGDFIWNYQPGDQVGVAVEGISTEPSQTDDSAFKTMWALPKNKCSAFDSDVQEIIGTFPNTADTESGTVTTVTTATVDTQIPSPDPLVSYTQEVVTEITTSVTTDVTTFEKTTTIATKVTTTVYTDTGKLTIVSGPTTTTTTTTSGGVYSTDKNMNACLEENLIDPVEGGKTNNIEVSLSPMPSAPLNDPTGKNSDELIVQASTLNTNDKGSLKYTWQVYGSHEPAPTSWGAPFLKEQMPGVIQTMGVGLSAFKMKMALQSPPKYLKIKVVVSEKTASGVAREGHTDVVIPVFSATNQVHIYPTKTTRHANNELFLEMLPDKERCNIGMEKIICPVIKNEIVGLSVPPVFETLTDFLWTIDNSPITPIPYGTSGATCLSGECDATTGEATSIAYFPILKEKGEKYIVNFSATNGQGQKLNISRTFAVVEPEATLISNDETTCQPVLLGNYVDLEGKLWPDKSTASFEAIVGKMISLKPVLNMPFATNAQWYIDNIAIDTDTATLFGASITDDGALTFPANKLTGETYSVAYTALYAQPNETKKFLNASYNVQLNEFYEKQIGHMIEITLVDSLDGTVPVAKTSAPGKILAAIITDVPTYLGFLFRIVLTAGLLLFVSWLVLSLFPKTNTNE